MFSFSLDDAPASQDFHENWEDDPFATPPDQKDGGLGKTAKKDQKRSGKIKTPKPKATPKVKAAANAAPNASKSAAKKAISTPKLLPTDCGEGETAASKKRKPVSDVTQELPEGWSRRESRKQPGLFYFANEKLGKTQFEFPGKSKVSKVTTPKLAPFKLQVQQAIAAKSPKPQGLGSLGGLVAKMTQSDKKDG